MAAVELRGYRCAVFAAAIRLVVTATTPSP